MLLKDLNRFNKIAIKNKMRERSPFFASILEDVPLKTETTLKNSNIECDSDEEEK